MALGDLAGSLGGADWRLAGLAGLAFMVQVLVQSAAWRIGMRAGGLGAVPVPARRHRWWLRSRQRGAGR